MSKLPEDAYAFYVSLGPKRSYRAVAEHYSVSKRTVTKRASRERWQDKLGAAVRTTQQEVEREAADALSATASRQLRYLFEIQEAIRDVATPQRIRAVVAAIIKAAVQNEDMAAARLLFDRVLGRPRAVPLVGGEMVVPTGLETASEVKDAANQILRAVAEGSLSPEDGQRAMSVVDTARKAVEIEDLERRITELERRASRRSRSA